MRFFVYFRNELLTIRAFKRSVYEILYLAGDDQSSFLRKLSKGLATLKIFDRLISTLRAPCNVRNSEPKGFLGLCSRSGWRRGGSNYVRKQGRRLVMLFNTCVLPRARVFDNAVLKEEIHLCVV